MQRAWKPKEAEIDNFSQVLALSYYFIILSGILFLGHITQP